MKYETNITEIDTSEDALPEWYQRLVIEREDLSKKLDKLGGFFGSSQFYKLSAAHQRLLSSQYEAMQNYHKVLMARLALSKETA
jgi:hypothetical protein